MSDQLSNKFEYQDFSKGSVFNHAPKAKEKFSGIEFGKIIDSAVSDSLNKNFHSEDEGSMSDIETHTIDQSADAKDANIDLSEIKTYSFGEDGQDFEFNSGSANSLTETNTSQDVQVDIEAATNEAYQKGYSAAEAIYLPQIEAKKEEANYLDLIKEKLSSLENNDNSDEKTFNLAASLLTDVAAKLHLAVPADFEAIILGEMVPILNKYHKKDKVIVRVNPDKVDYCNNLFRIGELSDVLRENIEVLSDETIAKNDCVIEWQDAAIEYKQEDIASEAERILDQLKSKIEN